MATHPVEPDEPEDGREPSAQPNTTRLPVEPEFMPESLPAEPEEPGSNAPHHPPR
jgi:hypothetical protein